MQNETTQEYLTKVLTGRDRPSCGAYLTYRMIAAFSYRHYRYYIYYLDYLNYLSFTAAIAIITTTTVTTIL